jgi:hypothetical protein
MEVAGSVELFDNPPRWSYDGNELVIQTFNGLSETNIVLTKVE